MKNKKIESRHENIQSDHAGKLHFDFGETTNQWVLTHWHEDMEILYVTKGILNVFVNDICYELKAGDIFLVNPNDIHRTSVNDPTFYYMLQIPVIHLEKISSKWEYLKFIELIEKSENENSLNFQMRQIFMRIDRLYEKKEKGYYLLVLAEVYRLLYLLYTEGSHFAEVSETDGRVEWDLERVKECMEYARDHYNENITLADASSLLSVTTEHFCRLFKKYTGQTFMTYVNQIRMEHFYADLTQTEDSILFLMEKNGIFNYKSFLKRFKRIYGETPQQLRKSVKFQN